MCKKIAALFSGQGAQYPGMGKSLYDTFPAARRVYECAGDIFGFDVAKTSFEGTAEQLSRTLAAQPVTFTLSMAAWEAAKEFMPPVSAVAGHSLGEFAALCAGGAFSLEDGFRLIHMRAAAMDEAAGKAAGAMYAIIGSDDDCIAAACEDAGGLVFPVNYNTPGQTVISGEEEAAARAAQILSDKGAKAVRLPVSSAFHTTMMREAADRFRKEAAAVTFNAPGVDFYSNLTGGKYIPEYFPDYFASHMVSPVLYTRQISAMSEDGIELCVEFGPGRNASAMAKKNVRSLTVANVEDADSLKKARSILVIE